MRSRRNVNQTGNPAPSHRRARRLLGFVAAAALTLTATAQNANGLSNGKDGFIFSGLEDLNWYIKSQKQSEARVDAGINLIAQVNKVLAKRNIKLVFAMVPMVERIYENKLPNSFKLVPNLKSFYQRKLPALQKAGVFAPDLKS